MIKQGWAALFALALVHLGAQAQISGPDTVCVNTVAAFHGPDSAISYTWSVGPTTLGSMLAPANTVVTNANMTQPTFLTMTKDGANYHSFVTNDYSNEVIRLDYGTNPLSTPTSTLLGTFGMTGGQTEGIEVLKEGGKWYGFVVNANEIVRLDFGTSITSAPTDTHFSFPAALSWPHQLIMKRYNGEWIAFAANRNGYVTRLDFGAALTNTPTATTLPNVGGVQNPCNMVLHEQAGQWYALITNLLNGTVSRYDFGANLKNNAPTGTSLGGFGGVLSLPRSITLFKDCDELVGLVQNESGSYYKLDFNNSILTTPTASLVGNSGVSSSNGFLPFHYNNQIHLFTASFGLKTINRFALYNTPVGSVNNYYNPNFSYAFPTPGTVGLELQIDQGSLNGAYAYCKPVVVLPGAGIALQIRDTAVDCRTVKLTVSNPPAGATVQWAFGDGTTGAGNPVTHMYTGGGPYSVSATTVGIGSGPCTGNGSGTIQVTPPNSIVVQATRDTSICARSSLRLGVSGAASYQWTPAAAFADATVASPTVTPTTTTTYFVTGTSAGGCAGMDSVRVVVKPTPIVEASGDGQPISCNNSLAQLHARGAARYVWHPGQYLNDSTQAYPVAKPPTEMMFVVEGYHEGGNCPGRDSVLVLVEPGATLRIPNVFTPNGDGLNDFVYPTIYCDFLFERFAMYNRWGQKVFESFDYTKGWNGRYDRGDCEQGVYLYLITGKTSEGKPVMFKGNVTLLR